MKGTRTMKKLTQLHTLVAGCFKAFNATTKTERADYDATVALIKATPLADAEAVKVVRDDLFATFGEDHKDGAQIRVNILNNARRVAHGGTKDGKAIKGKGAAAMLELCATVVSVRELRKVLAENVPEALKGKAGGDKKSGKGTGKGKVVSPLSVPKVATKEEAYAAARKILEFVRDKFTKPSETERYAAINACLETLK
jgi:hypothetical protein